MATYGYERNTLNGDTGMAMEDYGSMRADEKYRFIQGDELSPSYPSLDDGKVRYDMVDNKALYFNDGKKKVDFVLVYEESTDKKPSPTAEGGKLKSKPTSELTSEEKTQKWRTKYMRNLKRIGLDVEEDIVQSDKKMTYYVKLSAHWDILCAYAEDLKFRAPLQQHPNPASNWSSRLLEKMHVPNMMANEVPNNPPDYYTCQFKTSKLAKFLGSDDHARYFSDTQRSRVLWEILSTTAYGKRKRAEIGIERLLEENVFQAAFPLHDGPYEKPKNYASLESLNPRQILREYWARWGMWYKYQPLDHIREYFGEKIGIYFAWLGFYTAWLLPASVVGVLVFVYGLATMFQDTPANEVCDSGGAFLMCPLCDEKVGCQYWNLSDVCIYTRISYLFDHAGTVFFAVFMAFWAVTFLEYWKRKNASLTHHWDCMDFEEEEERPRPEFCALAPTFEKNPITGIREPHFPQKDRIPRILSGMAAISIMIILVLIFIVAVILYRVLIAIPLFQNQFFRPRAMLIASLTSACVNLIFIMVLGRVYEKLALKLTQWEMHRTQTEFEDQLTFKVFIFQFVNFYSSIFYIGFFKGKFVGYPGNYNHIFGLRNEQCSNGGCLIELAQQLAIIMVGKQIINNMQELIIPKLKTWVHQKMMGKRKTTEKTRWEEDYELIENEGLFQEYLEMVLQFGFITIFVAAFPLAPFFALLNNWIEIRLDSSKFVTETRRPVADRAQDIGVWFSILDSLAQLAVISNAFLIAFTSEFLPRLLYQYQFNWNLVGYTNFTLAYSPPGTLTHECRYQDFRDKEGNLTLFYWHLLALRLAFVICFEHVVFFICRLIDVLVPDVPESLELKIKRERYLAKQALADTETVMLLARGIEDDDDADGAVKLTVP